VTGITARGRPWSAVAPGWMTATAVLVLEPALFALTLRRRSAASWPDQRRSSATGQHQPEK